jgi:sugar lactone lactonase YvrE
MLDTDGTISTVAGDGTPAYHGDGGPAVAASLFRPNDVAIDRDGNLFIADTDNSCIRRVDPEGIISAVAGVCGSAGLGDDGVLANEIFLDRPYGIALADDGTLYIADTHNHRIVAVTPE